jgi:hypothetical protein
MPHRWLTLTQCLAGFALLADCHGMEPLGAKIHDPLRRDDRGVLIAGSGCTEFCEGSAGRGAFAGRGVPRTEPAPSTGGFGEAGYGGYGGSADPGFPVPPRPTSPKGFPSPAPVCGNGIREAGELCEPIDLNGSTCASFGYTGGGYLVCLPMLCVFDVSQCRQGPPMSFDAGQDDDEDDGGTDLPGL